MRFRVTRTSNYGSEADPPCQNVRRERYFRADRYTYMKEEDYDRQQVAAKKWRASGKNHREDKEGGIVRDMEHEGWFMSINSLDELMAFIKENGEVILFMPDEYDVVTIEIYDDFR